MVRICFLDIDGVLNSHFSICSNVFKYRIYVENEYDETLDKDEVYTKYRHIVRDEFGHHFDVNCLNNLETLKLKYPDLKFVISSSWRYPGLDKMKAMFNKRSEIIKGDDILDITDCFNHPYTDELNNYRDNLIKELNDPTVADFHKSGRGSEIEAWMRWYKDRENIDKIKYLILDDDSDMMIDQMENFVQTESEKGFTYEDLRRAIDILK